jgi:hypothetical protein
MTVHEHQSRVSVTYSNQELSPQEIAEFPGDLAILLDKPLVRNQVDGTRVCTKVYDSPDLDQEVEVVTSTVGDPPTSKHIILHWRKRRHLRRFVNI